MVKLCIYPYFFTALCRTPHGLPQSGLTSVTVPEYDMFTVGRIGGGGGDGGGDYDPVVLEVLSKVENSNQSCKEI